MKISKNILNNIIQEELNNVLKEEEVKQLPDVQRMLQYIPKIDNHHKYIALLNAVVSHSKNIKSGATNVKGALKALYKELPKMIQAFGKDIPDEAQAQDQAQPDQAAQEVEPAPTNPGEADMYHR